MGCLRRNHGNIEQTFAFRNSIHQTKHTLDVREEESRVTVNKLLASFRQNHYEIQGKLTQEQRSQPEGRGQTSPHPWQQQHHRC